jgi:hypothetical protein
VAKQVTLKEATAVVFLICGVQCWLYFSPLFGVQVAENLIAWSVLLSVCWFAAFVCAIATREPRAPWLLLTLPFGLAPVSWFIYVLYWIVAYYFQFRSTVAP